jgi:hypothetical protein
MKQSYLEHLKDGPTEDSKYCDEKKFQSLIGLLIQLLEVRPDIAFALSKIGQQQQQPTCEDFDALMHITNYLHATRYWGICLKQGEGQQSKLIVKLRGYADAAHAIHCDKMGQGKSQYGECFDLVEVGNEEN